MFPIPIATRAAHVVTSWHPPDQGTNNRRSHHEASATHRSPFTLSRPSIHCWRISASACLPRPAAYRLPPCRVTVSRHRRRDLASANLKLQLHWRLTISHQGEQQAAGRSNTTTLPSPIEYLNCQYSLSIAIYTLHFIVLGSCYSLLVF